MLDLQLRPFQVGDEVPFRALNEDWISQYLTLEEPDRFILEDPVGQILEQGGHIFMALGDGRPIACCALLVMADGEFELAKMTVLQSHRGQGIGRELLRYTIGQAKALGAPRLYLETSNKLTNAIHLYESLGFRHLPPEKVVPSLYARANVFMELFL